MNNISSQERLTIKQWTNSTHRFNLWKDYLFKNMSVSWEMEYWFYWMAYFMEPHLGTTILALQKVHTKDARYLDQIHQMTAYVEDVLHKSRCVLRDRLSSCFCGENFPCQSYRDRFKCYCSHWRRTQVGCLMMCDNAKDALTEDVWEMIRGFLEEWLAEFYYVWKLKRQGRIHFSVFLDIHPMPLDDIRLWEVVCEDDDTQILYHPLLPHPHDFIEKRLVVEGSNLYVDKARFEYQIPGSLSRYPVVLSKKRSILPRMTPSPLYQEEQVVCQWKQPTLQVYYTESSTAHKKGNRHKKRRLSKILKEGRKKNKTQWTRCRYAKNPLRQIFAIEQGEEYYGGVYDEYFYQSSDNYSVDYDHYDDYDEYESYYNYEW